VGLRRVMVPPVPLKSASLLSDQVTPESQFGVVPVSQVPSPLPLSPGFQDWVAERAGSESARKSARAGRDRAISCPKTARVKPVLREGLIMPGSLGCRSWLPFIGDHYIGSNGNYII
jgi:hypothetical protein